MIYMINYKIGGMVAASQFSKKSLSFLKYSACLNKINIMGKVVGIKFYIYVWGVNFVSEFYSESTELNLV